MANDNDTTHFTAKDIERYHQGQLSAQQMHALEKAAMDDPFLADALEGYAVPGVDVSADLEELKSKLSEKVEGAKVIPMHAAPRQSFRFLRAAVMILFVAGAGLLVYKLGFDKKANNDTIVSADKPVDNTPKNNTVTDSTPGNNAPVENKLVGSTTGAGGTTDNAVKTEESPTRSAEEPIASSTEDKANPGAVTNNIASNVNSGGNITVKPTSSVTQPISIPPGKGADDVADNKKKDLPRKDATNEKVFGDAETVAAVRDQQNRNATTSRRAEGVSNNGYYNNINRFSGRVVDADNKGVPFANVTNVQDRGAGTFTDVNGNFNLTYPDSVLNVQIRSIGFENNNVQLRSSTSNNQVVMQEDRKALSNITDTLSRQRVDANASRNRDASMKLETPEPKDGWSNYNTYVLNNIEIPEDIKNKPNSTGEVQVSFEVDKNGEPINIRIEKSLCAKCDEEAKRLIKEGPKWKRNANKKGRTTVTIAF